MIPTTAALEALERARWSPDPETAAALQFIVTILSRPESDGISKMERIYLTCGWEEQRCRQAEAAGNAFLQKRFKNEYAVFTADCPDDGRVRLKLRIGNTHADLAKCIPATGEININLLKPHDEWISGPRTELKLVEKVEPAKVATASKPARAVPPKVKPGAGKLRG